MFADEQITFTLKQVETATRVAEVWRNFGIADVAPEIGWTIDELGTIIVAYP